MTLKNLRLIRDILNKSLDALETRYIAKSMAFPSLDQVYPQDEVDLSLDAETIQIVNLTVSAAYQLIMMVRHPFASLADAATAYHLSACLGIAEKFNTAEILREHGDNGLHVDDIAARAGVEPRKLGRILRYLATHHIFREVSPNQFANNRISSYFDTGKSSQDILANPSEKYHGTSGAVGYIGTFTDEVFKASSHLLEALEDHDSGSQYFANKAAFQKAFGTNQDYFGWLEGPQNTYRFNRYGACIRGTSLWDHPDSILQGFEWSSLEPSSLVVDVGGGTGAPAMAIARAHPHLQIIIQEREPVVIQGVQYWKSLYPEALHEGRVSFQGERLLHDFCEVQPQSLAAVFLVRTIAHDWPDDMVVKILTQLRLAASRNVKLVLGDFLIPHACRDDLGDNVIDGAAAKDVPHPLLANLGKASANVYSIDMTMQVLLNGQERSLAHQVDIAAQAGWRVIRVRRIDNSHFGYTIAEPIIAESEA
ncbi:4-O-methyltransferase 1 [Hypsizygus marmoreus]|uniref:4-O-methyltransferase 1 n=1 Tax=Hypsizygus marmoreus TaxID=39966 RepID=A0A369K3I7_HYPMA|nr:4-O-methyltransferase 1 [Hypsizygus marmoreus]